MHDDSAQGGARSGAASQASEAIIAFLSDPATYPERPSAVETIETHMSLVFIAGDRVYKMKKPIRLDFVDFTTLEARRRNCAREIVLNRRLAPGVYRGLLPITRTPDGRLALGGDGSPVEWLVVMRRLDRRRLLDEVVRRNEATAADIDRLCDILGHFYAATPRIAVTPVALLDWWRQAIDRVEATLTDPVCNLPRDLVARPIAAQRAFLADHADLITARAAEGRIVDGHGDLRPEHIHLGPPLRLIDRLEFDERLRWSDPFDEAAFLGLECARLGADWIGPQVAAGLTQRLHDAPPAILLRFYACQRASMRARLSIEHLHDPKPRTPERWPRQARAYLDLALGALPDAAA